MKEVSADLCFRRPSRGSFADERLRIRLSAQGKTGRWCWI